MSVCVHARFIFSVSKESYFYSGLRIHYHLLLNKYCQLQCAVWKQDAQGQSEFACCQHLLIDHSFMWNKDSITAMWFEVIVIHPLCILFTNYILYKCFTAPAQQRTPAKLSFHHAALVLLRVLCTIDGSTIKICTAIVFHTLYPISLPGASRKTMAFSFNCLPLNVFFRILSQGVFLCHRIELKENGWCCLNLMCKFNVSVNAKNYESVNTGQVDSAPL